MVMYFKGKTHDAYSVMMVWHFVFSIGLSKLPQYIAFKQKRITKATSLLFVAKSIRIIPSTYSQGPPSGTYADITKKKFATATDLNKNICQFVYILTPSFFYEK